MDDVFAPCYRRINGDTYELVDLSFSLQAAITAAAGKRLYVIGTHTITAAIDIPNNTEIALAPGAIVQTSTANISLFTATGKTKVRITGSGKIKKTGTGTAAYVGGVVFNACTNCHVEGVEFEGMQWAGVYLNAAIKCSVRGCHMTGWIGTVQDAADVIVYGNSTDCIVTGNWLYGGGAHGVLVQDPYTGLVPLRTLVSDNHIGQHTAYGVVVYAPGPGGAGNSFTQIVNNTVFNIQGTYPSNRSSGAGVYVAGSWAGGTLIQGNMINNCCAHTLDRNLTPAGIGINGIPVGAARPLIIGNTITEMAQGDGILVASSTAGAAIRSNSIVMPSTNAGAGAGGATLLGCGIRVEAADNVTAEGNDVVVLGTGFGYFAYANGTDMTNTSLSGGSFSSVTSAALRTDKNGDYAIRSLLINGVRAKTIGDKSSAVMLSAVADGYLSNVVASCGAQPALYINSCTQTRILGGSYLGTGAVNATAVGTCTGSFVDRSVFWGTDPAMLVNNATGLVVG